MIRKMGIPCLLVCLSVLCYSQEHAALVGLGGSGGVSVIVTEKGIEPTGHVSIFWDRYLAPADCFIRLQYDLGIWSADRKKNETYGYEEFRWQIYHLSASMHLLLGSDALLFRFGLGSSLLYVRETEITRYEFDEDEDKLKTSAVSFGLLIDLGLIVPVSSISEVSFNCRYDLAMHPIYASRFSIFAGLYFLLN